MVLRVSPSCIVRTVMDKLAIEVNLAGSQRTLSRPQEEQLERSLFRLAAAAGGKRGPPVATRLLDASGFPLAPDTRAADAWSSAALLEVGDDEKFAVAQNASKKPSRCCAKRYPGRDALLARVMISRSG